MSFQPRLPSANQTPDEAAPAALAGEVMRIIYAADDGTFGVLRMRRDDGGEATLAGNLGGVMEGMQIRATGTWVNHPEHGRQFQVSEISANLPHTAEGIQKYLASGIIPGINRHYAEAIVKHFGEDTIDILDREPRRMLEVKGIGKKRLASIAEAWKEVHADRNAKIFLAGTGLSKTQIQSVIETYGIAGAPEIIRRNPYCLSEDIRGIGFATADKLAADMGIPRDSLLRLAAGAVSCLQDAQNEGHTCLNHTRLLAASCMRLQVTEEEAQKGILCACREGKMVMETFPELENGTPYYFTRDLVVAERQLAEMMKIHAGITLVDNHTRNDLETNAGSTGQTQLNLNAEQRDALDRALSATISVITGGPGVGKTTVVSEIVRAAMQRGWHVKLAAPTGRAAKRLSFSTGQQATTIHRLLQYDPQSHEFVYNADHTIPCDLIVVDEVSMLDIELARDLFAAIAPGTRTVLVGDRDQLPSVGPGTFLQDIIACGLFPVTHLKTIYRQQQGSRIITAAHTVNAGMMPPLDNPPKGTRGDFYFYEMDDPARAADFISKLAVQHIPAFFGFSPQEEIQILVPLHRGECGTAALNAALQEALNPPAPDKPQVKIGRETERIFRVGDRVMQTRNNYKKGVCNGECGVIARINEKERTFTVAYENINVEYTIRECDQLLHSYAVTVHKSQGSEFPVVIMPLLSQHHIMLQRNLLYTGITRARKLIIIVGSKNAVATAVRNNTPTRRCSLLRFRLTT